MLFESFWFSLGFGDTFSLAFSGTNTPKGPLSMAYGQLCSSSCAAPPMRPCVLWAHRSSSLPCRQLNPQLPRHRRVPPLGAEEAQAAPHVLSSKTWELSPSPSVCCRDHLWGDPGSGPSRYSQGTLYWLEVAGCWEWRRHRVLWAPSLLENL